MKRILWTIILSSTLSMSQSSNDCDSKEELVSKNLLEEYNCYDFSSIWNNTPNNLVYGILGKDHQRLRIKFLSVVKNSERLNSYDVYGKSLVEGTVCEFHGTISIIEIRELSELNYGIDDEYKNSGIKKQGMLNAEYLFAEHRDQKNTGIYSGQLYSEWYLDKKNEIELDDIEISSDGHYNNAFVGIWKSFTSGKEKMANWGDYRVPNANDDFDIGAGEFRVSKKYISHGWPDIVLKNQIPNLGVIGVEKIQHSEKWWE